MSVRPSDYCLIHLMKSSQMNWFNSVLNLYGFLQRYWLTKQKVCKIREIMTLTRHQYVQNLNDKYNITCNTNI